MTQVTADTSSSPRWQSWSVPAWVEIVLVVASSSLLLLLLVWGLAIEGSSQFALFCLLAVLAAFVGSKLGVWDWLKGIYHSHRRVALFMAFLLPLAFPFTQNGDGYWLRVFASIGVFAAAAVGLNIVIGLAGLLDLGFIAFFGVGAYAGALLSNAAFTTVHVHLPFILVVLIGACMAALFGLLIGAPTLRLRGDYLAIVTLGFGEIFRITVNNWDGLTRGPNGISGIPDLNLFGFDFGVAHTFLGVELPGFANYFFLEVFLIGAVALVFVRLNGSRIGRAWVAIREDEVAAAAMGVNVVALKLLAFGIGAFMAGAAGVLNAHVASQVSPDSYTFLESILIVAAVVLGGMGTVPGAILGSSLLFIIPEKLRAFQDKRLLLFGAALVLLMRFRPEGLIASKRRRAELHRGQTEEPGTVMADLDISSGQPGLPPSVVEPVVAADAPAGPRTVPNG